MLHPSADAPPRVRDRAARRPPRAGDRLHRLLRAFPDQIRQWVAGGPSYRTLGTDGYGRSDSRAGAAALLRGRPPLRGHRRAARARGGRRDRDAEVARGDRAATRSTPRRRCRTRDMSAGQRSHNRRSPGHRRLRRGADHRDPRLPRRHGRGRGSAGHARVRQGDDGRPRAGGRRGRPTLKVKIGDRVSQGAALMTIEATNGSDPAAVADRGSAAAPARLPAPAAAGRQRPPARASEAPPRRSAPAAAIGGGPIYASPSARRLARELGVELDG